MKKETPVIKFKRNWNNKLLCPCFSSLRLKNPVYYRVGKVFDVQLFKSGRYNHYRYAELVFTKDTYLYALSDYFTFMDANMQRDKFIKMIETMYKNKVHDFDNTLFSILLFCSEK